jgi:hypothetical protein
MVLQIAHQVVRTACPGALRRLIPKDCVRKIAVILRTAPRKTVFTLQGLSADRRIFIGNGRGPSPQSRRSRRDRAPSIKILRSAQRRWCSWKGLSARLPQNDSVRWAYRCSFSGFGIIYRPTSLSKIGGWPSTALHPSSRSRQHNGSRVVDYARSAPKEARGEVGGNGTRKTPLTPLTPCDTDFQSCLCIGWKRTASPRLGVRLRASASRFLSRR